jgi:hypothetical protein
MAHNYCEQGGGRTSRETVDRRSAAKTAAPKGSAMIAVLSLDATGSVGSVEDGRSET